MAHAVDDDFAGVRGGVRLVAGGGLLSRRRVDGTPVRADVRVVVVRDVLVVHAGGEGRAERAHEAGDVRSGDFAFGEQFERAQHGVVEERAALNHDGVAEFAGVAQFDDLVQGVAHDRIAQAGGDVLDGRAFLLCLLDGRVHEHGAARAQVHRVGGGERLLRELLDGQAHGHGEGLQERAAAGGACLVDGD